MPQKLQLLICEDQETDAFIITRNLENGGFAVEFERVESAEELATALQEKKWDIIISDYNIPGFGGREALTLVRTINREIPFILVSGMVGESVAVEMMRLGATDYLMKDSLAKLTEVVKRELDEAKIRKERNDAIEEIKINEQKYRAIIDNSLFAILLAPPNGKILESNNAASALFGYTAEEFKELNRSDLLDITDPNLQKKVVERDLYGRVKGEFIGIKKGGERFHCELASVLFKDVSGNTLSSTMISDITERKKAEEHTAKTKALLKEAEQVAKIGSVEIDLTTDNRIWSDGFYRLLGLEPQSVQPSFQLFLSMLSEKARETYLQWYFEIINLKKEISSLEIELVRNENDKRIFYANAVGLKDANGAFTKIIFVVQDITEDKRSQQEINESRAAALKNNAMLQSIINSPKDVFIVALDKEFNFISFTKGYDVYVKRSFNKHIAIGTNISELIPENLLDAAISQYKRALGGEHFMLEHTIKLDDDSGNTFYFQNRYGPIEDETGEIYGFTIFINDITAIREIELSNKLNEQRYSALFSGASDAIFIAEVATGIIVDVNQCAADLIGFDKTELIGKHFSNIHPPEELEEVKKIFIKMASQESNDKSAESKLLHKSGKIIPIMITAGNVFEVDNKTYSAAYFKDLSKSKEAESKIENISDLLNRAEGIAHIGSIDIDLTTNERIWSDEFYHILGYLPGQVKPQKELFIERIVNTDKEKYQQWYTQSLQQKGAKEPIEVDIIRVDGERRHLLISGMTYANASGKLYKHIGVVMDITLKKVLENDLAKSHEQLKKLTDTIPIAILRMETSKDGTVIFSFVSQGIKSIFYDIEQEDILQNADIITDRVIEEDQTMFHEKYYHSLRNITDFNIEFRVHSSKETISWIKIFHHPEIQANGNVIWYGYMEDITLQKQINLNLEKQNKQLKEIAWTQSHLVRAPLSRLMGLAKALQDDLVPIEDQKQYLNYVMESAAELDKVIKDITHKTVE